MAVKKSVAKPKAGKKAEKAKTVKKAASSKSPTKAVKASKTTPKTTSKAKATTGKKAVVKKAVVQKPKVPAIAEVQTKAQIITAIATDTGLTKKDVGEVLGSLAKLVAGHMTKGGSGEFTVPDIGIKLKRVVKPATKARTMISPFTKQEITVPAKPASDKVRLTALKALKDTVV